MSPIKPQKKAESLETLVAVEEKVEDTMTAAMDEIIEALPAPELIEEIVEEPATAPVGAADFSTSSHVAPQVLEEAHVFLNRYGIQTADLTPKEVMTKIQKIQSYKEESAQVLSRGQALDGIERLLSFLPKGYTGSFMRENDMDISRAETQGFKVFISDEARLESSTGTSDGRVRYGDQILMMIPEEKFVANRLLKSDRLAARRKSHNQKAGAVDQGSGNHASNPLFPLIKL